MEAYLREISQNDDKEIEKDGVERATFLWTNKTESENKTIFIYICDVCRRRPQMNLNDFHMFSFAQKLQFHIQRGNNKKIRVKKGLMMLSVVSGSDCVFFFSWSSNVF